MPQLKERPSGLQRMIDAKRAEYARLSAAERVEVDRAQREARERATDRRARAGERTRKLCSMVCSGAKAYEIAAATGLTVAGVETACRRLGLPFTTRATGRYRVVWLTDDTIDALDRVSLDRGATAEETMEDAMTFLCADDALILRRLLRVKRRSAP